MYQTHFVLLIILITQQLVANKAKQIRFKNLVHQGIGHRRTKTQFDHRKIHTSSFGPQIDLSDKQASHRSELSHQGEASYLDEMKLHSKGIQKAMNLQGKSSHRKSSIKLSNCLFDVCRQTGPIDVKAMRSFESNERLAKSNTGKNASKNVIKNTDKENANRNTSKNAIRDKGKENANKELLLTQKSLDKLKRFSLSISITIGLLFVTLFISLSIQSKKSKKQTRKPDESDTLKGKVNLKYLINKMLSKNSMKSAARKASIKAKAANSMTSAKWIKVSKGKQASIKATNKSPSRAFLARMRIDRILNSNRRSIGKSTKFAQKSQKPPKIGQASLVRIPSSTLSVISKSSKLLDEPRPKKTRKHSVSKHVKLKYRSKDGKLSEIVKDSFKKSFDVQMSAEDCNPLTIKTDSSGSFNLSKYKKSTISKLLDETHPTKVKQTIKVNTKFQAGKHVSTKQTAIKNVIRTIYAVKEGSKRLKSSAKSKVEAKQSSNVSSECFSQFFE